MERQDNRTGSTIFHDYWIDLSKDEYAAYTIHLGYTGIPISAAMPVSNSNQGWDCLLAVSRTKSMTQMTVPNPGWNCEIGVFEGDTWNLDNLDLDLRRKKRQHFKQQFRLLSLGAVDLAFLGDEWCAQQFNGLPRLKAYAIPGLLSYSGGF